jgi:hypothetical protein
MLFFQICYAKAQQDTINSVVRSSLDQEKRIEQRHLIDDVRQLVDMIESIYPDPCANVGGNSAMSDIFLYYLYRGEPVIGGIAAFVFIQQVMPR